MFRLLTPDLAELPRVIDPRYPGDSESRYATLASSADRALETGIWTFCGSHTTPVHTGYDEVLVIVEGELEIESDDGCVVARPGDVIVYEPPVAPQLLSSPKGIVAVYVIRHHHPKLVDAGG